MTFLIGALSLVLLVVVVVQIGKVTELASTVRGEKTAEQNETNKWNAGLGLVFMVVFLGATIWSFNEYSHHFLGWGPNIPASEHGDSVDNLFKLTLFFTGVVFFVTQFLLFWYAWKYRGREGRKAVFWAHDERLEMVWMMIPAVVMTFLVVGGLQTWNEVMADVEPDEDYIEVEATGMQFAWLLRHPGADGKLGETNFRMIDATNPLGQDWTDKRNHDDLHPGELVLPVGKKVRVRIASRDVIHNFYLPQFRVKMDAVPGIVGHFVFTPIETTADRRKRLSQHEEWQVPSKIDPEKQRWETFDYELACAELCGRGHYSMQKIVKVVTEEEYEQWLSEQSAYYETQIKDKVEAISEAPAVEEEVSETPHSSEEELEETAL